GINEADREKVFERFYRIGSEDTRQTKGTGLGLYIVQNIVSKHRGRIRLLANAPQGSVFEIMFNAL
ncbi:MAG: ATP-binding protein, partial [Bacteroidota bacterium]